MSGFLSRFVEFKRLSWVETGQICPAWALFPVRRSSSPVFIVPDGSLKAGLAEPENVLQAHEKAGEKNI
jgi:hypothetical protein